MQLYAWLVNSLFIFTKILILLLIFAIALICGAPISILIASTKLMACLTVQILIVSPFGIPGNSLMKQKAVFEKLLVYLEDLLWGPSEWILIVRYLQIRVKGWKVRLYLPVFERGDKEPDETSIIK